MVIEQDPLGGCVGKTMDAVLGEVDGVIVAGLLGGGGLLSLGVGVGVDAELGDVGEVLSEVVEVRLVGLFPDGEDVGDVGWGILVVDELFEAAC